MTTNKDGSPRKKPGPKGVPKIGEKVVKGYIIGRNNVVVPPEEVEQLAGIGMKDTEIADWFGVNDNTLRSNFKDILTKGRTKLKMSLRQAMYKNAVSEMNTTMQIWLSKNLLGMSDSPLDSEANAPLPWKEYEDDADDITFGEEDETQESEDLENDNEEN